MGAKIWVRWVEVVCTVAICEVAAADGVIAAATSAVAARYDFVVANDGSGNFTTVQAGLAAARELVAGRGPAAGVRVFIKAGVYKEKIVVRADRVTLLGEDAQRTVLTYDDHVGKPDGTTDGMSGIEMPSTIVRGDDFTARNLTFANTAGPVAQASALWVDGDRARLFDCRIVGYQDTLYTSTTRQFYKRCYIEGSVDFIYGSATAVFDRCTLFCTGEDGGCITAAATPRGRHGYLFRRCAIMGTAPAGSVWLGRPWRRHAEVVFVKCSLGGQIAAVGWDNWGDTRNEARVRYAEYRNIGEGAKAGGRVNWSRQLADEEAGEYTLKKMFTHTNTANSVLTGQAVDDQWYRDRGDE